MADIAEQLRNLVRQEVAAALAAERAANANATTAPELVTLAAYAQARSISVSTVRTAIRDGRLTAHRIGRAVREAWSKLRRQVRGWRYALDQLVAAGAAPWDGHEPTAAWALRELHRIGRPFRHRGNHRYLIPLSRACRRALPGHLAAVGLHVQPYPRAAALPPAPSASAA